MNDEQLKQFTIMQEDIKYIKEDVKELKDTLKSFIECAETKYVNKIEFDPIKKVVYGMVGVILVGVITALFALIIK